MPARRSLLDRLLKHLVPRPVAEFAPDPREVDSGLWVLDRQICFRGGLRLPTRATIVRLGGGGLVVIAPPPVLGSRTLEALASFGPVEHVVVPNTFHYVYAAEFMARYPDAELFVAPGLSERVPELPPALELAASAPEVWAGELEIAVLGPVRGISEVVFFHLPSGTLILTDLAFNTTDFERFVDRLIARLAGMPAGFAPGRTSRRLLLRDHALASRCLTRVSGWPIQRIIMAHGEIIERNAKAQFLVAFAAYVDDGELLQ